MALLFISSFWSFECPFFRVSSCLKTLSSSYVIRVFSSPQHVSAVHHCQTGNNNDNTHTKKLHFPRVPLCLVAFGWGASLIQKSIQFCRIDSQPPDRQKAASSPRFDWRRCLIQAQMSAPEHWLLTKTKINQARSDRARSVRLPAAVMWLVLWKIDLTASKRLCEHCGSRCVL